MNHAIISSTLFALAFRSGTNVSGNKNWFKVSKGYVSAYY